MSRARAVSRELLSSSCKFLSVKRFGTETFGLMFCQQWEMVVEADPELRTRAICVPVSPWVEVRPGDSLCVCLALGLRLCSLFPLCLSRPCHGFSVTPWGRSHRGFDVCAQSLIDKEVLVAAAGNEKGRALN